MKTLKSIMSWVVPILIGLIIALLVRSFLFEIVRVDGTSMEPNLLNNERVFVMKQEKIKHFVNESENKLDLQKDQHLMSIRQNNKRIGDIEIVDGKITTCGIIGNNQYDNFLLFQD